MTKLRIEKDSLGKINVPNWALYGAQTQRAIENFPISDLRFSRTFIRSLGIIKEVAASTNLKLGLLDESISHAIQKAAEEVSQGKYDQHFPLDIFQTGSCSTRND